MAARAIRRPRGLPADDAFHAGRDLATDSRTNARNPVALCALHVRLGGHCRYGVSAGGALRELAARNIVALSRLQERIAHGSR